MQPTRPDKQSRAPNLILPADESAGSPPTPADVQRQVASRYAMSALEQPTIMEEVLTAAGSVLFDHLLRQQAVLDEELKRGDLDVQRLLQLKPLTDQQLQLVRQIGRLADFAQRADAARRKAGASHHPG